MLTMSAAEVDFIEELRLRRWARENYVPHAERSTAWHPIILEEMRRKDQELAGGEDLHPVLTTSKA